VGARAGAATARRRAPQGRGGCIRERRALAAHDGGRWCAPARAPRHRVERQRGQGCLSQTPREQQLKITRAIEPGLDLVRVLTISGDELRPLVVTDSHVERSLFGFGN
jgi:hypothetical protein